MPRAGGIYILDFVISWFYGIIQNSNSSRVTVMFLRVIDNQITVKGKRNIVISDITSRRSQGGAASSEKWANRNDDMQFGLNDCKRATHFNRDQ